MNRKIVLLVIVLFIPALLSAQALSGWWTGGNFGLNGHFSDDCSTGLMVDLDIFDFAFRHNQTGLQLNLSPMHFDSFSEDDDEIQQKNNLDSFLNVRLGLDLLKESVEFDLMPFISLNWDPREGLSAYRAEAGIRLDWYTDIILGVNYPLRVKIASVKTAYGFRRNVPYYTVGASIDFGALVHAVVLSWLYDEVDD